MAFVAAAAPAIVAVSAGHRNRFGHPHADVVDRYREAGADLAATAEAGALVWRSDDARRFSDPVDPGRSATAHAAIRVDE
jgi:beta-lactamase superfamily II metal-dependent hydrolase